jgi:hypothetical protein
MSDGLLGRARLAKALTHVLLIPPLQVGESPEATAAAAAGQAQPPTTDTVSPLMCLCVLMPLLNVDTLANTIFGAYCSLTVVPAYV